MAIDLSDYSKSIKTALKRGGFCCVYVASAEGETPCRIGYSVDLPGSIASLQRTSPVSLIVQDATWLPDRGIATMIAKSAQAAIGRYARPGGWFDLRADAVIGEIDLTIFRLYPGATAVKHRQLIGQWGKK
jgi:hypothetical protein